MLPELGWRLLEYLWRRYGKCKQSDHPEELRSPEELRLERFQNECQHTFWRNAKEQKRMQVESRLKTHGDQLAGLLKDTTVLKEDMKVIRSALQTQLHALRDELRDGSSSIESQRDKREISIMQLYEAHEGHTDDSKASQHRQSQRRQVSVRGKRLSQAYLGPIPKVGLPYPEEKTELREKMATVIVTRYRRNAEQDTLIEREGKKVLEFIAIKSPSTQLTLPSRRYKKEENRPEDKEILAACLPSTSPLPAEIKDPSFWKNRVMPIIYRRADHGTMAWVECTGVNHHAAAVSFQDDDEDELELKKDDSERKSDKAVWMMLHRGLNLPAADNVLLQLVANQRDAYFG